MTLKGVLHAWRARGERAALERRRIPDALWQATLERYPFLTLRDGADAAELRRLTSLFLDQKEFTGAQGLHISDEIAVTVAAQACLPVLRRGLEPYASFIGIVIQPDRVWARRSVEDDIGVVHEFDDEVLGEMVDGGPVMLSWRDVQDGGESEGRLINVVIHEFAHVLDRIDGQMDGMPPLPSAAECAHWMKVLMTEYERHCEEVDAGIDTLLDPYGAEAPEEFFAVASEHFFVAGAELYGGYPALYTLLRSYYRQNPGAAPE